MCVSLRNAENSIKNDDCLLVLQMTPWMQSVNILWQIETQR